MAWDVEYTDQFGSWWGALDEDQQEDVAAIVNVLEQIGPALSRPYVDSLQGSRHSNLKELRVQSEGNPLRVFFAFDPRRTAILLIGGDKTGLTDKRFYDTYVPIADRLYDEHLKEIGQEKRDG